MSDHKRYLGDLIGGSLMLRESQILAGLMLKDPTPSEWNEAIVDENILQKPSAASAKRNASTIKKRLSALNNRFLEKLAYSCSDEASQLMFAATLINSPLLADFMRTVVVDAKQMYRESLTVDDWHHFWQDRSRLYPALAEMSEASTYKVSQVAFKVIADAGYIDSTKNKQLLNVYVTQDVRELLSEMDHDDVLQAMEL